MVYLDYAATSPLSENVQANISEFAAMWYNPSSAYGFGDYNARIIENVRGQVAKEINASPDEIYFTSSGSESNAMAIRGIMDLHKDHRLIISPIEHSSIMELEKIYPNMIKLPLRPSGVVDAEYLLNILKDGNPYMVSVMMCNNEIGTYEPIRLISDITHRFGGIVHTDAVQAFGKIKIDVRELGVDLMSMSGHKIGALRGVGILYVRKGTELSPLICGTQESGSRGGSYNDLAIKSLGLALQDIDYDEETNIRAKRDYLFDLMKKDRRISINGTMDHRNASNINIRIRRCSLTGQQIVSIMDQHGFMISAGSACHAGDNAPSHVLKAIGLTDEQATHSIRITIGKQTTIPELEDFYDKLTAILDMYCDIERI